MLPVDVLRRWFAAHASGDIAAARSLIEPSALVVVPGQRLTGFDAFVDWYRQRAAAEQDFSYHVEDLLSGETHAAAVLTLRSGSREWRQVALYEIRGGRIRSIWAVEDIPSQPED